MKPRSVGLMLKDQSNGCSYKKNRKIKNRKIKIKKEKEKSKKIGEEKSKKKGKSKKIKKRKRGLFSVVLGKMCVFCFYPIPDSQQ